MRRFSGYGPRTGCVVMGVLAILVGTAGCGGGEPSRAIVPKRPAAVAGAGTAKDDDETADLPALATVSVPVRDGVVDVDVLGLWRAGEDVRMLTSFATRADGPLTVSSLIEGAFLGTVPAGGIRLVDVPSRRAFVTVAVSKAPTVVAPGGDNLLLSSFRLPADVGSVNVLFNQGDLLGPLDISRAEPSLSRGRRIPRLTGQRRDPAEGGARSLNDVGETAAGLVEVRTKERREVSLPSDVLFAKGDAALSARAGGALDAAAETLRALPAGTVVTVVGHTDDDGTDDYNLDLSRRRAESVRVALAERLGERSSDGEVVLRSEGKGEREPVAPNRAASGRAIDENQALNRRVVLAVPDGVEVSVASLSVVDGTLTAPDVTPATSGVSPAGSLGSAVATRSDAVGASNYRLDVTDVSRADGAIRVSLTLQVIDERSAEGSVDERWGQLFGADRRSNGRIDVEELSPEAMSVRGLRLVAGGVFRRPLVDDATWVLGSRNLGAPLPVGSLMPLTVAFADPSPGAATVDLQVPTFGVFRGLPID